MHHQGAGAISASGKGSDVIQDGGRKRKLLLLLDGASKSLLILLASFAQIIFGSCSVQNRSLNQCLSIVN